MKTSKHVSLANILLLAGALLFGSAATAGYLVDYQGDGYSNCGSCYPACNSGCGYRYHRHHYHHHYHHSRCWTRARSNSHYEVAVYYTWAPYPDYYSMDNCGCQASCQPRCVPRCATRCQVREPRHQEARWVDTCRYCNQGMSFDRATADDTHEY